LARWPQRAEPTLQGTGMGTSRAEAVRHAGVSRRQALDAARMEERPT